MEPKDKRPLPPYVKGIGPLPRIVFPQTRRLHLVELVVTGKLTAEEVCEKENIPLGTFSSWCNKFLRAGRSQLFEMTYPSPPVGGQHKVEVTLSDEYFEHIQETMRWNFFFSVEDVIEHALFLQSHFLKANRARSEEDRRQFEERLAELTEQAKAKGVYDTPEFNQLIANLYIGIDDYEEWAEFWADREFSGKTSTDSGTDETL